MARDETEGSVIRAIATCLHESGRIDASVDEITARLEAREDALWTAQIRPLLDKLEDRLTTPTAFQTTHDRLVARAREDWLAQTAERVWRETFVIVPAAVTQVLFHTTREYDNQTRGTYESYSGVELFDEDKNLIDDDALPELLGLSNADGEDAKECCRASSSTAASHPPPTSERCSSEAKTARRSS